MRGASVSHIEALKGQNSTFTLKNGKHKMVLAHADHGMAQKWRDRIALISQGSKPALSVAASEETKSRYEEPTSPFRDISEEGEMRASMFESGAKVEPREEFESESEEEVKIPQQFKAMYKKY